MKGEDGIKALRRNGFILQAEMNVPDEVTQVVRRTTTQTGSVDSVAQAAGRKASEGLLEVTPAAEPGCLRGISGTIWSRTLPLLLVAQPSSTFPLPSFPLGVAVANSQSGVGLLRAPLFSGRTEHARA